MNPYMQMLLDDLFSEKKVVVITGAGISTLSGINPFRGQNGLYAMERSEQFPKKPEYYLSRECFEKEPEKFYQFYTTFMMLGDHEPNIVHNVLTNLEKQGLIEGIITQNIDNLHQKSGSEKTTDIHGNGAIFYCAECGMTYTAEQYKELGNKDTHEYYYCQDCGEKYDKESYDERENNGKCDKCNGNISFETIKCHGRIRPDIVLYQEDLDIEKTKKALELIDNADIVLVLGTSLTVSTARELLLNFIYKNSITMDNYVMINNNIIERKRQEKRVYIVNQDWTQFDRYAIKFNDLKQVFETIQDEINKRTQEETISKVRTKQLQKNR